MRSPRAGRGGEALALIDEALAEARASQIGMYLPEMWRLRGELLLQTDATRAGEARAAFERAAVLAGAQGAHLLHLRAATSLARLLADGGDRDAAGRLLRPLYAQFAEGFDRPDLVAAARLVDALG